MQTANINIRTDSNLKRKADALYNKLGLTMSTAINMFLKESVRTNSLPLSLKLDEPNEETIKAIEESKEIVKNKKSKGYTNIKDLRKALGVWVNTQWKLEGIIECHIEPNWLLEYQYFESQLILMCIRVGSHNELFK